MICKGDGYEKQYEENTTYEENGYEVCKSGVMHFCENPFDVLNYYPLVDDNCNVAEFAEVEALGDTFKKSVADDKTATNKLHIGAKLNLNEFIKACIDFSLEKTKVENKSSGKWAQLASSGDWAQLASSGNEAKLASSGNDCVVCAAGIGSIAKAKVGSWITLSEWRYDSEKRKSVPVCVKTEQVDGERIKEDTFYKLENGEFVEVK